MDFCDAPWGLPHERQELARREDQKLAQIFLDQLRERPGRYRRVSLDMEATVELVAGQNNLKNIASDDLFTWHREKEDGHEYLFIKYDG